LLAKLESIGIKICPQKAKGKYSRFIKAFERTNSNLT